MTWPLSVRLLKSMFIANNLEGVILIREMRLCVEGFLEDIGIYFRWRGDILSRRLEQLRGFLNLGL